MPSLAVDIADIGLVHLSGVEDARPRENLTDDERIMLTEKDRLQTCEQIKHLEARGYQGVYAFEPFAPELASRAKRISAARRNGASRSFNTIAPERNQRHAGRI